MLMLQWTWILIIGICIGFFAGVIASKSNLYIVISTLIGIIGALLGEALLKFLDPNFAGQLVVSGTVGSIILVLIVSLIKKTCNIRREH